MIVRYPSLRPPWRATGRGRPPGRIRDEEVDVSGGALDAVEREREAADQRESEPLASADADDERDGAHERVRGTRCRHPRPLLAPDREALNRLRGPCARRPGKSGYAGATAPGRNGSPSGPRGSCTTPGRPDSASR